jgi:predicted unusual protein kinase regulating ubiquinone biosynthesis (AarF/ABC1/UbiB family)
LSGTGASWRSRSSRSTSRVTATSPGCSSATAAATSCAVPGIDDSDLSAPPDATEAPDEHGQNDKAARLADDLEKLGPTFVKVGQFLSTRVDLLPADYIAALARLQDKVEPFSFGEVERIVAEEIGVRLSKAFAVFEDVPVAAASLGQVHRAELRDGRAVAVKVQRPDIEARIREDLEVLGEIATFLDGHTEAGRRQKFAEMFDEFRKSLLRELDYRQEARNLSLLADHMSTLDRIMVPRPVEDYVTSRVLTMEFVEGRKVTALSPLAKLEIDGAPLAEEAVPRLPEAGARSTASSTPIRTPATCW